MMLFMPLQVIGLSNNFTYSLTPLGRRWVLVVIELFFSLHQTLLLLLSLHLLVDKVLRPTPTKLSTQFCPLIKQQKLHRSGTYCDLTFYPRTSDPSDFDFS